MLRTLFDRDTWQEFLGIYPKKQITHGGNRDRCVVGYVLFTSPYRVPQRGWIMVLSVNLKRWPSIAYLYGHKTPVSLMTVSEQEEECS